MTTLKSKAEKEKANAEKKIAAVAADAKRCRDDEAEVMAKAEYKKDVVDKKIKEGTKTAFDKMKKEVDDKVAADKKKQEDAMAVAKKKEADATTKFKECDKKERATSKRMTEKCRTDKTKLTNKLLNEHEHKLKEEVADGVLRATTKVRKETQEKFDKQCNALLKDCDEKGDRKRKKCDILKVEAKEECERKINTAKKEVPPEVEKEFTETKDKLTVCDKDHEKAKSDLIKSTADGKEVKATLSAKLAKQETITSDCQVREKALEKSEGAMMIKAKTEELKVREKENDVDRLTQQLKATQGSLETTQEALKEKEAELKTQGERLHQTKEELLAKNNKIKMIMSKMSAGEGALMSEIETLKKSLDEEKDQTLKISRDISVCRSKHKDTQKELASEQVKLRETAQNLYSTKRDLEKETTKYETLQMAHQTTTERYRDVSNAKELCQDRMKDAKVKALGCEESMTRMKTYHADENTEQKMELARLRQELDQTKAELQKTVVGQQEKEKAEQLAKQATESAVAKAVEAAQANALAVKTNAQEAVDQAAKEAVKIANDQARAAADAENIENAAGAAGATLDNAASVAVTR